MVYQGRFHYAKYCMSDTVLIGDNADTDTDKTYFENKEMTY